MIISASRRTDIPSLYGEWMANRLAAGEAVIPNPYNTHRATRLIFSPETVDCIVFWTKNPIPFEQYLSRIEALGYEQYYFQYTLTAFGSVLEPGLPPIPERVEAFRRLSKRLGPERVDWRFDPIILDDERTPAWYAKEFERLCETLAEHTTRCILSFVDHYVHLGKAFGEASEAAMKETAGLLAPIAERYGLPLFTCAEVCDLSAYGIRHAACVDREKVESLLGCGLNVKKDHGQRPACGCVESTDIGVYNTCVNGCAYCYATKSRRAARQHFAAHDPAAPMLTGPMPMGMVSTEKRAASCQEEQMKLL